MASPSDSLSQVYLRVGEALNTWSQVEDGVMTVFLCALSARNYKAAQAAFAEIISFDGKLSACDAAISIALAAHPQHLSTWVALSRRLGRKKKIRNKLAHAQVLLKKDDEHARLFPFYSLAAPSLPDWDSGWSAKAIVEFTREFMRLNADISQFIARLRTELGMWPTE